MAKMRFFLRESTVGREPLAVSMSSVRPGERVLQIGVNDPRIVHAIASKVGITGLATIIVPNESSAQKLQASSGDRSSMVEPRVEPLDRLPLEDGVYDVAIIHNMEGLLASLDSPAREQAIRESRRILRPGGRLIVLETGRQSGMRAIFGGGPKREPQYEAAGGTMAVLQSAGFTAVRELGDRDGYRFIEGLRPS
jgi:ubiquinone/menaquinone biosynthesis C-methylase UbiE